jgi:hypothetical protein
MSIKEGIQRRTLYALIRHAGIQGYHHAWGHWLHDYGNLYVLERRSCG